MTTNEALYILKHIGKSTYLDSEKEHALMLVYPSVGNMNKLTKDELQHVLEWLIEAYVKKGDLWE